MTTLRWPDGRGKFVDDNTDRTPDGERMEVFPGTEITVEDDDVADHYVDRGFVVVEDDGSDSTSDDAEPTDDGGDDADAENDEADADGSSGDFDATAFTDRTPVSDVVDDIEAGEADGHLDAVKEADDRVTVEQAVEDRKDAIGGE
jgi:hypothetical protein